MASKSFLSKYTPILPHIKVNDHITTVEITYNDVEHVEIYTRNGRIFAIDYILTNDEVLDIALPEDMSDKKRARLMEDLYTNCDVIEIPM